LVWTGWTETGGGKIKPFFFCGVCDYKTPNKHKVVGHVAVHAKIKPFRCSTCGRGFTRKYGLIDHLAYAHGIVATTKSRRTT
jgi:hypothetical protein